jgi:hypothetical protein
MENNDQCHWEIDGQNARQLFQPSEPFETVKSSENNKTTLFKEINTFFDDTLKNDPQIRLLQIASDDDLIKDIKNVRQVEKIRFPQDVLNQMNSLMDFINYCNKDEKNNNDILNIKKQRTTIVTVMIRQAAGSFGSSVRIEPTRDVSCKITIQWTKLVNLYRVLDKIYKAYLAYSQCVQEETYEQGKKLHDALMLGGNLGHFHYPQNSGVHTIVTIEDPFSLVYPPTLEIPIQNGFFPRTVDEWLSTVSLYLQGLEGLQAIHMNFICTYPLSRDFIQVTQLGQDNVLKQHTDYKTNPNVPIKQHMGGLEFIRERHWDLTKDDSIEEINTLANQVVKQCKIINSGEQDKSNIKRKSPKKSSPKKSPKKSPNKKQKLDDSNNKKQKLYDSNNKKPPQKKRKGKKYNFLEKLK